MTETSQFRSFRLEPIANSRHAVRLTMSNPPINLVNSVLLTELNGYLTSLEHAKETAPKVIVVSSDDPDIWISHLDLHIISAKQPLAPEEGKPEQLLQLLGSIIHNFKALSTIFIAEVDALAVGGGNEFALSMDMRFAGPSARFGIPEVAGGVVHGGAMQSLTKLIGAGRAMEMMVSARAVSGVEADRIGLVNRSFQARDELRQYVNSLASRIALFPRGGLQGTKQSVQECLEGTGSMGKDMQRLGALAHTEEAQNSITKLIELGRDQQRSEFELGLPDTEGQLWEKA